MKGSPALGERAPRGSVVTEVRQKEDAAAYQRLWRARRSQLAEALSQKERARKVAALKVAKRHPEEFAKAIQREERRRGIA